MSTQPFSDNSLLSIAQAQKVLGLGRSTLYRLMNAGRIAWVQIGSRRKFEFAELLRFIRDNRVAAPVSA